VPSERQFLAAAAAVAVVSVAAVGVAPGALAPPDDDPVRPGAVTISGVDIAQGAVTGETATLAVETRLQHRGPPAPNVTAVVRAVDTESGLLTRTRTVSVGELTDDRERVARANLTVPREGGYRVETVVYVDGRRVDEGARTIRGLSALTPPRARSTVAFAERGGLPPLAVSVAETDANRTTLAVTATLENAGDTAVDDLSVRVAPRQAESNVVAADQTVEAGRVRPGRTAGAQTEVTVPAAYNYRVSAVLLRDGVVLDGAETAANLNPTRTVSTDTTREEVTFDAGEFERDDDPDRGPRATDAPTAGAGPGFGAVAPLVAALALAVFALVRRRAGGDS